MNVSSLIITTPTKVAETIIQQINEGALCEYHAHIAGKIVVAIKAATISEEIKIMKSSQKCSWSIRQR